MKDLTTLDPLPAGFPACVSCPYFERGTPDVCFPCATGGLPESGGPTCEVCGKELPGGEPCDNAVCSLDDPWFSGIHAVSLRADDMWSALCDYKYEEDRRWAEVLGRILVGYLEARGDDLADYDLITTGALYVGPRANRLWDHLRLILDAASRHGRSWPFEPDLIAKSGPTGQFLGRSAETRRRIAEHSLREALSVPEPEKVAGKRVLVLDDVYSEGYSMREMARSLREAGATEVAGLVYARKKGG